MKRRINFERRINLLALAAGLPGSLVAGILLWTGDFSSKTQWTVSVFVTICWIGFAAAVRERVVFPLRTFSNLLAALREGDFSFACARRIPMMRSARSCCRSTPWLRPCSSSVSAL